MFGLPDQTRLAMQQVFEFYPEIQKVIIYGSRVKGNYRPGSDIDLTLLGENLDDRVLNGVLVDLDDLNAPYLMDVSLFEQLGSQSLIEHIERIGQVFYDRAALKVTEKECEEGTV